MDPDSSGAETLHGRGIKNTEALECLVAVPASLLNPEKITRKQDQQDRQKEQVIKEKGESLHEDFLRMRIRDSP